MDDCLGFCNREDEEGMSAVEAIEVAEVEKASIFGVSGDEDLLINALSQAASGSQTSSNAGEMNLID